MSTLPGPNLSNTLEWGDLWKSMRIGDLLGLYFGLQSGSNLDYKLTKLKTLRLDLYRLNYDFKISLQQSILLLSLALHSTFLERFRVAHD